MAKLVSTIALTTFIFKRRWISLPCWRQVLCVKLLAITVSHVSLFVDTAVGDIPLERVQGKSRDEERSAQCAHDRVCDETVEVPVPYIFEETVEQSVQGRTHEKRVGDNTVDVRRRDVWEMRCSRDVE